MRFSGLPGWDVELWKYNLWVSTITKEIKFNSAINLESDSTNEYVLVAEGTMGTLYANYVRLSRVIISAQDDGRIAFFAYQHQGTTTCTFEDAWVWVLDE
ncbi:MAG: hypothetical protein FVQ83_05430 [Chloroflexi bacterium]|nr:hypothetical protein [Chloroflexota bacterium]